ncbi:DUF2306 domain-containing protein [Nocardia sp. NPDC056611]|uniref:DUF2306 domain-containing protein n=1 Tax=Nocardia sp. NPDC056611 TaxID=3345877 RepID=UPI003671F4D6
MAWLVVVVVVMAYSPLAIEYMWHYFATSAPQLWQHVLVATVGERQASGMGSVAASQSQVYRRSRTAMLVHTMAGGLSILVALAQFSRLVRERLPAVHRWCGYTYVALVVAGMTSAIVHLVYAGPDLTFDGPPFYIQLWFLATATLLATLLAAFAARTGRIVAHRTLMGYSFALLLTAPVLRLSWLVFGIGRDTTQESTNMLGGITSGFVIVVGAIVASRHADMHAPAAAMAPRPAGAWFEYAAWAGSAMATVAIVLRYRAQIGTVDSEPAVLIGCYLVVLIGFVLTRSRARRAGPTSTAHDWRIHCQSVAAAPAVFLAYWTIYALQHPAHTAFRAAALTAPASTLSLGLFVTIAIRWNRRPEGEGL